MGTASARRARSTGRRPAVLGVVVSSSAPMPAAARRIVDDAVERRGHQRSTPGDLELDGPPPVGRCTSSKPRRSTGAGRSR